MYIDRDSIPDDYDFKPAPEVGYRGISAEVHRSLGGFGLGHINRGIEKHENCGTQITCLISCGCSSIPIMNGCGYASCPTCYSRRAMAKRKKWKQNMKFDRGKSYRFMTLTHPRRFYTGELGSAVKRTHQMLRKWSKTPWWRHNHRLWFGCIEVKPAFSELESGEIIVTWNVHVHLVTGGRFYRVETLREKWQNYGGGRVDIQWLGKRTTNQKSKVRGALKYLTKYMTHDSKDIASFDALPSAYTAWAGEVLRGAHLFISGGHMRTVLPKRFEAWKEKHGIHREYCWCSKCKRTVNVYLDIFEDYPYIYEELPRPDYNQWETKYCTIPPPEVYAEMSHEEKVVALNPQLDGHDLSQFGVEGW